MAAPTPTTEPAALVAGDTATWQIALADYPATDGWALAYTLINAAAKITFTSSSAGSDHLVNVAASTTAGWTAGTYSWRCQATNGAQVFTVASGTITVQAAFGTATFDARTHARKTLDAVEAYLENPQNLTAAKYEIAGRALQRMAIPDLLVLRSRYQFEVAQEEARARIARGLPDPRRVMVRFGP